ncbi:LysR family transcriptional regulator [Xenorhabdus mauleonii]|uniref:DNA-binding transcriptional regulator, LysR family n=1 Tax=Xenorhabdus mauleonii TaxID=351675 RepID=A0A1I3XU33_9GAMM|nr:LysR family transcriptional regulator [Xenorhabdus mauleonii]PHM36284.1 LysR family transcriptional regulator [Xenorhabdus mauleonii]SFK22571.1 DNA-binding transcriptional regulator, LysR family [Xenorhabdus mauleonii]
MKDLTQINARSMQIFLAILGEGSLSEVARREGISPSSVSRTVQLLEQALETPLLYRNTRAVSATDEGRMYADAFRNILQQLDETQTLIGERKQIPNGRFRFNAPLSFGLIHITPWVGELSNRYPELSLELNLTDDFIDPLVESTDLLLRISPMKDSGFHGRFISNQTHHLVASPEYLEKHGTPTGPEDLKKHHLLTYKGVMGPQCWSFQQGKEKIQFIPEPKIASNNAEVLTRAVEDGAGIILFPDWQINESMKQKRVIGICMDYVISTGVPDQSIYMLYPGNRYPSLNTRVVIDFFLEKFGTPPYWK